MKFALGAVVLALLLGTAFLWQRRERVATAAELEQDAGAVTAERPAQTVPGTSAPATTVDRQRSLEGLPPGWSRVIVGAPSAAAPVGSPSSSPAPAPSPAPPTPASDAHQASDPPPAPTFELTVQKGQTLSTICQEHYQSALREIVEALARANHLADEGSVREGQKLILPPLASLLQKHP